MKTYKDFEKKYIGGSDVAALTLTGCTDDGLAAKILYFGGDGDYYAYIVNEKDIFIGEHYKLVCTFRKWVRVYDDNSCTFNVRADIINIYQAGSYGVIIQFYNNEGYNGSAKYGEIYNR